MLLSFGIGLFELLQCRELVVPTPFQLRRDQTIIGVYGILLTLGELDLIARLCPLLLPLLLQRLAFVFELLNSLQRALDLRRC